MNELQTTMNGLSSSDTINAYIDSLDNRYDEAETTEDFKKVLDAANTLQVYALSQKCTNEAVRLSNIRMDCERSIVFANPPKSPEDRGQGRKKSRDCDPVINNSCIPNTSLRDMRKAHAHLTDAEHDQLKQQAIDKQEPNTRALFKKHSKAKTYAKVRQERDEKLSAQSTQLPTGEQKFAVIYADPPWRYNTGTTTPTRKIENQYPTMDIEEIKALDVQSFCHTDAVLYLWATVPLLPEALSVIDAWGFKYKSAMAWVKDSIGLGYWARSRFELLLIGVKGKFPPPTSDLSPDAVVEAPRTKHSKKPVEFAEMLETLYPNMAKIELFCRTPRQDWYAWGNEVTDDSRL